MQSLWFWKDWAITEKRIFWSLIGLSVLTSVFFCFSYFQYPSLTFIYDQFQELKIIESALRNFKVGLYNVEVLADNLVLYETFRGSSLQAIPWVFYTFFFIIAFGLTVMLTFISTLKRIPFFVGIGLFILIIVNFHWETLQVFGLDNKIFTVIMLFAYVGLAYFFQSIRPESDFQTRLLLLSLTSFTVLVIVHFGSRVANPFLHLATNGLITAAIISIVFIAMISHEITASFVTLVTNTTKPTRSAAHYYIITAIYIANLILTYLIREKYIFWNIITINSFLLLMISSCLGLWGLKRREPLYSTSISNLPSIFFLYLAFFSITVGTIAFCFATENTPLVEIFNDGILFMHIAYGIIFTAYVTANFGPMLLANLPVHRIVYKPTTMPFFTFRTMSLIATFAFLSFSSPLTTYFDRVNAGYYNTYGDVFQLLGDTTSAEAYYRKSIANRNQNHHAHYALATLYTDQLNPAKALKEYDDIITNIPSEIAYLNVSDSYQNNYDLLSAKEQLTMGIKFFPASGVLLNAKALNFYEQGLTDSAFIYFQKARRNSFVKNAAETNLFASGAQLKIQFPADSLLELLGSNDMATKSNAIALANVQDIPLDIEFELPNDTLLSVRMAALLSNQLVNQHNRIDTTQLKAIISLARKSCNSDFKEPILLAAAHCSYGNGLVRQAFELLREIAFITEKGKYFHLLGIWQLEQNNPSLAAHYFKTAKEKKIREAASLEGLAWMEADSLAQAIPIWDSLSSINESQNLTKSDLYKEILSMSLAQALNGDDQLKYAFCRYRLAASDSVSFFAVLRSVKDEELQTQIIFERSKKLYLEDEPTEAIKFLSLLNGRKLSSKDLADEIAVFNLMLAIETSNWDFIRKKMDGNLPEGYKNEKILLAALIAEQNGQSDNARKNFTYLANANSHFEEAIIASARFFLKDANDRLKPHSILVNGLLAKPYSIKLLKEYVRVAALLNFDEEVKEAMEKLKKYMTSTAFIRYINGNPDLFVKEKE